MIMIPTNYIAVERSGYWAPKFMCVVCFRRYGSWSTKPRGWIQDIGVYKDGHQAAVYLCSKCKRDK